MRLLLVVVVALIGSSKVVADVVPQTSKVALYSRDFDSKPPTDNPDSQEPSVASEVAVSEDTDNDDEKIKLMVKEIRPMPEKYEAIKKNYKEMKDLFDQLLEENAEPILQLINITYHRLQEVPPEDFSEGAREEREALVKKFLIEIKKLLGFDHTPYGGDYDSNQDGHRRDDPQNNKPPFWQNRQWGGPQGNLPPFWQKHQLGGPHGSQPPFWQKRQWGGPQGNQFPFWQKRQWGGPQGNQPPFWQKRQWGGPQGNQPPFWQKRQWGGPQGNQPPFWQKHQWGRPLGIPPPFWQKHQWGRPQENQSPFWQKHQWGGPQENQPPFWQKHQWGGPQGIPPPFWQKHQLDGQHGNQPPFLQKHHWDGPLGNQPPFWHRHQWGGPQGNNGRWDWNDNEQRWRGDGEMAGSWQSKMRQQGDRYPHDDGMGPRGSLF